jgi:integrase
MPPRKAALRVAHQKGCVHEHRTSLDSLKGCKCRPSYYVMSRDTSGATRKSARVKDRRLADKILREKQVEIDKGHAGYRVQRDIAFADWADEYQAILEGRPGVKGSTRRVYADTLKIARDALGYVSVREIGNAELRKFHDRVRHTAESTQIKHLTQLGACLSAAVDEGYADRNPVTAFRKPLRLRAAKGTPPFTDGEVAKLLQALRNGIRVKGEKMRTVPSVYLAIIRASLETGARIGELIALDWCDVNMTDGKIRIRHTYDAVDGLTPPKDRDARNVYLTLAGQEAFGDWIEEVGVRDTGRVFTAPRSGEYLNADYLRKIVLAAMTAEGVPKIDAQSGRPRKPLHSWRATYARRMLEQGKHPQWVEAQLGHADLELTIGVYGAWSEDAMRAEASRV